MAPKRAEKKNPNIYTSPILDIYVRGKRQPIKVHKEHVEKKSSFLMKFDPIDVPLIIKNTAWQSDVDAKSEQLIPGDELDQDGNILMPNENTFDLTHTKTRADVVDVFVHFLYATDIKPIKNAKEAKVAIRAYVFAIEMECTSLQNALVDRMREYHKEQEFELDLLLLLNNRYPSTNCEMVKYLVRQFAYDITNNGYDQFKETNRFIDCWLKNNQRDIREDVFKAVVDIAEMARKKEKIIDPAHWESGTECKWHVHPEDGKCVNAN